ncbi:tRNA pseudouridine(38-40) synthase TruA [Microbacterium dextranolyticum]|uniref:tRNA pseudouridine synthase A n=1 Tax=Microbacterium dextranolyticum TaxID=36806 RepID=A0A9W6M4H3_9MICO|nr:tRNA pseudouridine(38-40) synthase TruA [Microbacterium dextranolyticum]MBM7462060.1 tRNA pseudouridine38-40 synthase [Microbacterium dextranolyticum]GLJ94304.1 tRNA pseudouridine synthase A [Microbacterium dextranolyticum]
MRLRLDLAYDGTDFRGWARQPGLRTVQGTVEAALARILGGAPQLVVAGRTDAGVHASGQVAHLDLTDSQRERLEKVRTPSASTRPRAEALAARIAGVLGPYPDVAVHRSAEAAPGFDARFSAVWRRYSYRIADLATPYDPLDRARTTTVKAHLDVDAMDAAARSLIGLHDFAAYCKWREGATTIRTLLEFDWHRGADGILVANVRADAFCHSMVRALVGACVGVGEGRLLPAEVERIRDEGVRTSEIKVLAARGLTLTEVGYPADDLLAARADQTRARRSLDED